MAFEECGSLRGCPRLLSNVLRCRHVVALFWTKIKAGVFLHAFLAVAGLGTLLVRDHGAIAMTPLPEAARQPTETEPKASAPAVKEGLEIVVKPTKAVFAEMDPLVFTVTLTNTSDKSFMLFESGYFWDWKIRFGDWHVVHLPDVKRAYPPSTILERGKSIQTTVALDNTKDLEFHLVWKGIQLVEAPPPARFLPAGKYPLVIDVRFAEDIRRERLKDYKFAHWTGAITTNPVIVEIAPKKKPKEGDPVVLDNKNNGETISVPLGSIVEVRLAGTRNGTGWEGGDAKGDALLHLNQQKGQPGQKPSRPGLLPLPFGNEFMPEPGAADRAIGTYFFIYQAVKEGRAEINMAYIAPGGPGVTGRRRSALIAQFKVTIDVKAITPKGAAEKAPGKLEEEKKEPRFVPIASYPSEQRATEKRIRELLDAAKIRFITVGSRGSTVNVEADQANPARAILEKAVKDGTLSVQLLD